jgi:hypothetical protein
MKKIIILAFVLSSCQYSKTSLNRENIDAVCEKVIIIPDSANIHLINFLISFKNKSNEKIILFNNTYSKKSKTDFYSNAGLIMSYKNIKTPIGQFNPNESLIIDANSEVKILYSYNKLYPNKIINLDKTNSVSNEIRKIELFYKYNKDVIDKKIIERTSEKSNISTIEDDFKIDMSKAIIEYKQSLTIKEVVNMTGGKITK